MSPYELFRLAVWAFGVPIIVLLVIRAVRKVRDIRALHQQLLEEEAAAAKLWTAYAGQPGSLAQATPPAAP